MVGVKILVGWMRWVGDEKIGRGGGSQLVHLLSFASLFKGIVNQFFSIIFWIVMGCGIADFGRKGL